MAFNGTGTFSRLYNWVADKVNAIPVTASRVDAELDGMATGLSQCITKDGQTTITANIPFNSNKITGVGNGTARTDVINVGQVQDNQFQYLGTTGGTADAYTLSPSPTITAYATTQQITAKISATNLTTTPYLQVSAIASPTTTAVIKKLSATKTEIAVEASDLLINGIYHFQRNSANDAWIILNPEKAYFNLINATKATTTTQGVAYLNNLISVANNVASPNDVVDFGAGTFITSAGNQIYLPAITKKIQSSGAWTAGTGQNGLDSGARTASTFYRTYVIQNNSSLAYDILFSTSATSPTVPSGYTNLGIINYAIIRVNASTNIATAIWDVNEKQLVLGAGQAIQIFSGVATGPGNTVVMNTTEKLEFKIRLSLATSGAGGSDISVYGSEHDGNDSYDVAQATTNNGFTTSIGPVSIWTSDGKIYWKNFSTAGGVSNQTCKIKSIKIRS
jgi:hypothetical protein